jgi:hypothetical protein
MANIKDNVMCDTATEFKQLPGISLRDTEEQIKSVQYHHFEGTNHTVCCIKMKNGFTVTGESCCVHDAHFVEEFGRKYAYQQALDKAMDMEAYMLKQRMFVFGR